MKLLGQLELDKQRQYYRVTLPAELTAEEVGEWLFSISGALHGKHRGLFGQPGIAFEVHATQAGITHSMRVPWRQASFIIGQLQAKIPGVYAERAALPKRPYWLAVHEYGESHPEHTLNIPNPTAVAERILNSMSHLREHEEVLMQWVVTAVPIAKLPHEGDNPDQLRDQRTQLEQLNLGATLRIGATAKDGDAAKFQLHQVEMALATVKTSSNRLRRRLVLRPDLDGRIERGSGAFVTTSRLKVNELAGLIGWANNDSISGLPRGRARVLSAPTTVPSQGIVIGKNPSPGQERPVAIGYPQALTHTWIGGRTGVGKSALMANMAYQIMHAGHGLILMESEGDLYENVLSYVPRNRVDDVVLLDFADQDHAAAFNVLDQGSPDVVIDELINLFEYKYGGGLWSDEYIYNGLKTLGESSEPMSITDVLPLINPRTSDEAAWADDLIRSIKDPELKRWWQRHDNRGKEQQQQRADPVLSRMNQFTARPELRYVFGQRQSSFKVADVLRDNKILLINLKGVSSNTSSLVGTMLMNAVWHAVKTSQSDQPTYLMLDEFADFMDLPVGFETMLAQARKRNLGLILANQHLSQLTAPVREGILANARNKIAFQSKEDDAKTLLKEMGSGLAATDITNLQLYEALADVVTPTGTSGPFSVRTNAPFKPTDVRRLVMARSREKYTRSMYEVRDELLHRYDQPENPKPSRPRVSGSDW